MIRNIAAIPAAFDEGAYWLSHFYKSTLPTPAAAGRWVDLSMGAGTPIYNAYVGNQITATPLTGARNTSIFVGPALTGYTRYLHSVLAVSTSTGIPATLILCDYLLAYPLVDGDNTDLQEMDNTLGLPRYADGVGVQAMIVCTTPMTANAAVTIGYTNSAGVPGRTSTASIAFSANVGNLCSSMDTAASGNGIAPFIKLEGGDLGIRSIDSVQLVSPSGGLFSIVLVRPLATVCLREQSVAREVEFLRDAAQAPEIKEGAFLNFIACNGGTAALSPLIGTLAFIWR